MKAFNDKLADCAHGYIKAYCAQCLTERLQGKKRVTAREREQEALQLTVNKQSRALDRAHATVQAQSRALDQAYRYIAALEGRS
jgi:hypothetical protein